MRRIVAEPLPAVNLSIGYGKERITAVCDEHTKARSLGQSLFSGQHVVSAGMNIFMVLTSHGELGATGYRTGLWLAEFTIPYYLFTEAGAELTLASPSGGAPAIDPRSLRDETAGHSIDRFRSDQVARTLLSDTLRVDQVDAAEFDGAFFPGGHGALWDLARDEYVRRLITLLAQSNKPVAFVCHSQAALLDVVDIEGKRLVFGRTLTCFSNAEESAAGTSAAVPFSLQNELIRAGAVYSQGAPGTSHVVKDGWLITGQNAGSAGDTARELLRALQGRACARFSLGDTKG